MAGPDPTAWVATLAGRNDLPLLHAGDLGDLMLGEAARVALAVVADKRATLGRLNVFAEVLRQFHGVRFAAPGDRIAVVERATDLALGQALLISPLDLAHTPAAFQRADGTSRFRARGFATYTLDAENRLLDAGRRVDGPGVSAGLAAHVTGQPLPGQPSGPVEAGESVTGDPSHAGPTPGAGR